MSKILIVAATPSEAAFLSTKIKKAKSGSLISIQTSNQLTVDVLVTGPGITATVYHMCKSQINQYDLAVNIGICGSLHPDIHPVRVVNVISEQFGDFGAENNNEYLDMFEMGLLKKNEAPFKNGSLFATYKNKLTSLSALPKVNGITVQRVHGSASGSNKALKKFGPVVESMEGAAFFYVCNMEKVKCLQLRAVSNKVEKRNRASWKINEAIDALAGVTGLFLMELESRD